MRNWTLEDTIFSAFCVFIVVIVSLAIWSYFQPSCVDIGDTSMCTQHTSWNHTKFYEEPVK